MMMMNHRCGRCGRSHQASTCTLKAPCTTCIQRHVLVLHELNERRETFKLQPIADVLYLDCPTYNHKVLLKVGRVIRNGVRSLETYTVLDDGSRRTILLHAAAKKLGLYNKPDVLGFLHDLSGKTGVPPGGCFFHLITCCSTEEEIQDPGSLHS